MGGLGSKGGFRWLVAIVQEGIAKALQIVAGHRGAAGQADWDQGLSPPQPPPEAVLDHTLASAGVAGNAASARAVSAPTQFATSREFLDYFLRGDCSRYAAYDSTIVEHIAVRLGTTQARLLSLTPRQRAVFLQLCRLQLEAGGPYSLLPNVFDALLALAGQPWWDARVASIRDEMPPELTS